MDTTLSGVSGTNRAYGRAYGLRSERARRRADELADDADLRIRVPRARHKSGSADERDRSGRRRLQASRDRRLPLAGALRRKKGRSDLPAAAHQLAAQAGELLRALRYERALVYEELGKPRRARSELDPAKEGYAEAPDYEDVAAWLGL